MKAVLGSMPYAYDVIKTSQMGFWAFELDEGCEPRMYGDELMMELLGVDREMTPEEVYRQWYDNIDIDHYDKIHETVNKMSIGINAEVQYPWHYPDGRTIIVRCEGVNNPNYTKGLRIEGTHRDVTNLIHFEKELQQEQKIAEQKSYLEYFIEPFSSAFNVDLVNDTFEIIIMDEMLSSLFVKDGTWDDMENFIVNHVHPEDQDTIRQITNKEYIINRLKHEKVINFNIRELHGNEYRNMKGLIIRGSNEYHISIGFMDITDTIKKENELQKRQKENYEIIKGLALEYTSVYYVDLIKNQFTAYSMNDAIESAFGEIFRTDISFTDAFAMYVQKRVSREDKQSMLEAGSLSNISKELSNLKSFSHKYLDFEGRYSEMKCVKVGTEEGVPVSFVLGFADKDEEIRNEIKQKEQKERDEAVIAGLSDDFGCVVYTSYDDHSEIHYRFDSLLSKDIEGWTQINDFDERLHTLADTVMHPDDRERFLKLTKPEVIKKNLYRDGVCFVNFRTLIDDNVTYYQAKFVRDEKHPDTNVIVGFRNVDAETKREIKALEKAKAANKAKTSFLFNMSHDIRTPMNAIIGFTNMAMKYVEDKEKVIDSLQKTQQAEELLLSLINNILDMSRIESGRVLLHENPGDMFLAFTNIEATMKELARAKNIDLSFEIRDIKDRYVYCDFNRCLRVFVNIITNAIKYTNEGGHVQVLCKQVGNREGYGIYRFEFIDNGIGISEEFQKHVFDEFSRENTTTVTGVQGTGLGLSVCKHFVEAMNGTIECESEQGVGTTFTVTLPFKLQDQEKYVDPISQQVVKAGEESQCDDIVYDFENKRALLVEDNELNIEITKDILKDERIIVETANDGTVAVKLLEEKGPDYYDFILMDIQMPLMDGYEATKIIRRMYPGINIPIIALSANAFVEDKAASIAAGLNDHIAKPININELNAVIAKNLR